jgi:hypothetical protein
VGILAMEEIQIEEKKGPDFELPWCPKCLNHTEYINSSGTVQRANLDGGTFSEVVEKRKCLDCDGTMVFVSECKFLIWFARIVFFGMWIILNLPLFYLFEVQSLSWVILSFSTLLFFLLIKIPHKSRKIIKNWKSTKEKEFLELLTEPVFKD